MMPHDRVVLASNNRGKLREFHQLLHGLGLEVLPQAKLSVASAEETGLSFVENALIKARHAARATGLPAIADDSGLEVDALRGAPGIYSARFAGADADDAANCAKLLRDLEGVAAAERSARFRCLMVYLRHADDPTPLICQGTWEGRIAEQARGDHGFGYDPVFQLDGRELTAAELAAQEKNRLSHRGQALRCLVQALAEQARPAAST